MKNYTKINPERILFKLDAKILERDFDSYKKVLGSMSQYLAKVFDKLPDDKKLEFHEVLMDNITAINNDIISSLEWILYFTGLQLGKKEILQNSDVDPKLAEKDIRRLKSYKRSLENKLNQKYRSYAAA